MSEIEYRFQLPSADEYNSIRSCVGWTTYTNEVIEKALPNSLFCVSAYAENSIIGMARIIGDNGMVYYIQDVIVLPKYQGKGIGTVLMEFVMKYINVHASNNSIIGLMSAKGKEYFYERFGFTTRPTDMYGSGMTMFWKILEHDQKK